MASFAWLTTSRAFMDTPPPTKYRTRPLTEPYLDRELHALARDHHLDPFRPLVRLFLSFDADTVERVVAAVRIVVIEDQALHVRLHGDVDRARDRRVAPGRLEVVLGELRVVDEGVGPHRQRDDRVRPSGERVLRIGRVEQLAAIGPETERA